MRLIHPDPDGAPDLWSLYGDAPRVAPPGRPYLLGNMVASIDGATAVDGLSGGLGGEGDRRVFAAVRSVPDVIVVAAGTARAENYGPPKAHPEAAAARADRGQDPVPELAVITRSADLDPTARLFDGGHRPLIITTDAAPDARLGPLTEVADVAVVGADDVEPGRALAVLAERGHRIALLEGGPTLNGQFVAAGLVDELCVSMAPVLVSGPSKRLATGPGADPPTAMALAHLLEHDDSLFARYVRADGTLTR